MRSPRRATSRISCTVPLPSRTPAFRIRVSQFCILALSGYRLYPSRVLEQLHSYLKPLEVPSLPDKNNSRTTALTTICSLNKGLGFLERPFALDDVAQMNWNLLREDLSLPSAVLYEEKLRHNLNWMQQFITAYG